MKRDILASSAVLFLVFATNAAAQTVTPGLQGDYWGPNLAAIPAAPGVPAGNPNLTRVDATVDFVDATFPGAFANADMYVVRWTGFVRGPITGTVTFFTNTDDGVELVVNNVSPALISNWTDHGPTDDQGNFDMVQGLWYPIRLTYYERGGGAVVHLTWSYTGQARAVISSSSMSATTPPGPAAPTLSIATPQNRTPVIDLSWTSVANASGYSLLRSSQSGTETPYQALTATTYSDTGVGFGATYFYVVKATVGATTTPNSNEVSGSAEPLPPRTTKSGSDHHLCGIGTVGGAGPTPVVLLGALILLLAGLRRA